MILVTGSTGQLGSCFQQLSKGNPSTDFLFADSEVLDISDKKCVQRFFMEHQNIEWVINCAAYTAVDKAESEPEKARQANVKGVKNLAEACAACGATLIHFSTDYVYHSRQNTPFEESDSVSPKSVYGSSKLAGERAALKVYPQGTMVIRTSWVYSPYGHKPCSDWEPDETA